jgi:hypothetical protein
MLELPAHRPRRPSSSAPRASSTGHHRADQHVNRVRLNGIDAPEVVHPSYSHDDELRLRCRFPAFPKRSSMWYHSTVHRLFQDDLASVSVSRMLASGLVTVDTASVVITLGEGKNALKREVRIAHHNFWNGGNWSFFVCPTCGRLARTLKLHEKPMCRRCCLREGIGYRISSGSVAERAEARIKGQEKLRARLAGGPARLKPRPGRTLDHRGRLEASLQRAHIVRRGRFQFHG